MFDLLTYAAPFFVALLIAEWLTYRHTGDHTHSPDHTHARDHTDSDGHTDDHDQDHTTIHDPDRAAGHGAASKLMGYEKRDTATSLAMGLGNMGINAGWKLVVAAIYAGVYELSPLRFSSDSVWTWLLLVVADDFAYYWYHRVSHQSRLFWGSHVVHHSSEHYNLSTALRQPWVPMTAFIFWIPLAAIGIPPWMIILQQAISLSYQFFIHTERVGKLPRPFEFVLNTPSHHRGHHGSNQIYLDKNYGGITIIWDRLFGTFQPETEPVRYGLTKNIGTFNPITVATHEYAAIIDDVRNAESWHDRLGYVFRGPGWAHDRRTASAGSGLLGSRHGVASASQPVLFGGRHVRAGAS